MIVNMIIELNLETNATDLAPHLVDALENLGNVMCVQAEDGLYSLGSPDAEAPGDAEPNAFVAGIRMCTVESIDHVESIGTMPTPEIVRQASTKSLLRAFAALTHQMHASGKGDASAERREQRDVIEAEILNRA